METYRAPLTPSRLNMDEEPGAVINRLLEDGDVQIIDPPTASPFGQCSAPPCAANTAQLRANSETLADLLHNPPGLKKTRK